MKKIIILKTDRVGDLLHLSGCIRSIHENFKDSKITLVCSKYNFQIAKNYSFINKYIIIENEGALRILIKYFNLLMQTRYTHLFLLDSKNRSLFISCFIKAEIKSVLCLWKVKRIFNLKYNLYRPNKFLLRKIFKNYLISDENYSNTNIKYQDLYFKLLENIKIKISSKKNYYLLNNDYNSIYQNFYKKYINDNYCVFHFDERWDKYNNDALSNSLKIISNLSKKTKVILTTGIRPFKFLYALENLYCSFNYDDSKKDFLITNNQELGKILILKNMSLDLLAYFINNSTKNISSHSGPVLNLSTAFDKEVVDIIIQSKFKELGRWIPFGAKYKRYSFENLSSNLDKI